jgi:hypothetical protein
MPYIYMRERVCVFIYVYKYIRAYTIKYEPVYLF